MSSIRANTVDASELSDALAGFVPTLLEATGSPGLTLAVADRYGPILTEAYGVADLDSRLPMTPATPMRLGSMSKLYVSCAVLQLVDDGKLDLHTPIENYVDYPVRNPLGPAPVTPYHMLTHTSGLRTDILDACFTEPGPFDAHLERVYGVGDGYEYGGVGRLWTARVAERYQYSNVGMATLANAVTRVSGMAWHRYVRERIFRPLGVTEAVFPPDPPTVQPARGYARFGTLYVPSPTLYSRTYPASGLLSSARSHAALLSMLLSEGVATSGERVMSASSVRAMVSPHTTGRFPGEPHRLTVGLGIEMHWYGRRNGYIGHAGAFPFGWWGESRAYPQLGHGGVVVVASQNDWDITRFVNPVDRLSVGIVADYVADWYQGNRPKSHGLSGDRAARSSYAAGLLIYERIAGLLGTGHLSDSAISEMVDGLRGDDKDVVAFQAGIGALRETNLSPHDLKDAFTHVGLPHLGAEALRAGGSRAVWPAPMRYFADRHEESPRLMGAELARKRPEQA